MDRLTRPRLDVARGFIPQRWQTSPNPCPSSLQPTCKKTIYYIYNIVVAFCAALIGGGAVGAKAEITASVPAGALACLPRRYALVGT